MKGIALLLIVLANLIGGTTYLAQKMALEGLPPATVTLLRNLVALACLAAWVARSGGLRLRFTRPEHLRLMLAGTLGFALPLWLGIVGLRGSTSGNASILILLEPPSILIFSWLLLRERIQLVQALGIAVGLGGALWIVMGDAPLGALFASEYRNANLILAAHGLMWGLYSPLMLPLARTHRATDVTFAAMAWSLVLLVPATLLESEQWQGGPALAPALVWTGVLGVVAGFGATLMWVEALRYLDGATVAPFVFLQPLAGVLAGHLVLDERLSGEALAGGVAIAAGVALVLAPGLLRAPAAPPASRSGS